MSDYFEVEARLQEALAYKQSNPGSSLRFLSGQFKVSKDRIRRRLNGIGSKSQRPPTNQKLDKHQDQALSWYINRLDEIGVPLRYKLISQAANEILAAAHSDPSTQPPKVGERWSARWLKLHP